MAEGQDSSAEKSEEPTAKRLQKSREEGQIPRSKELNTMAILIGGAAGLLMFGDHLGMALKSVMQHSFSFPREVIFDIRQMGLFLGHSFVEVAWALAPFLGVLLVASIVGPISLGGWLFSAKALAPKFSRLNPVEGIKRMFALKSLVELLKSIAKVTVVVTVALLMLNAYTAELLGVGNEPVVPAMGHAVNILAWIVFWLACSMVVIAVVDVPFQIYDHNKKLKMTKQEVKDEYKDTEGKPEVKQKVRQLQMEMAQRRMMQDVPKADVVITNPTHFSIALKYDGDTMVAPVVLAKGGDEIALKIREIAKEHNVEIVQAPPLARSIYYNAEVGDEIPSGLYVAVAQILAYIFQLRRFRAGANPKPQMPDFPIPDDLKHD
ncbi:flagellar biosynthesis protein FlhB [Alkalimarinus sediminis]|uniref:Flagellar biosynthetic protein FlhB n=1 Tax=Alkalimarinus sediminis TaxID=1632866 RepID=A0A9E8HNY5_9ALTE|nr:flagellar biosynthesis protein FlhB [Alkalimarinus sediminis]UZW76737.1 flagellar biosynthesis protein FlhB [Alkalimarinus sediminis]